MSGQDLAFSRRSSSASMASRMNCARRFGPAKASILAMTSSESRTCVGLTPSAGLPILVGVSDTAGDDKPIPPIDCLTDTVFISDIGYGDKSMTQFQLDTSGAVDGKRWSDLSPFTQGYIEALFAMLSVDLGFAGEWTAHLALAGQAQREPAFSDLARETLARIIADCAAMRAKGLRDTQEVGRSAWEVRQMGATDFPPQTVQLDDDGKVRFA